MKTKKQIKQLKKEITTESAINIGYSMNVINHIPIYAICKAQKSICIDNLIHPYMDDVEITNVIITEAVKSMNYQDFKDIYKYFFG